MRIAIAAEHANSAQLTGVEHYARELILALARIDRANTYLLYLRNPPRGWCEGLPDNFEVKWIPFPAAWTQVRLSLAMLADRPDALLVPSFSMPLLHPRNTVVTIHDLAWRLFPETENSRQRQSLAFTHAFARLFARRLIAVSESTRKDLIESLGIPASKVEVVHHGFSQPVASAAAEAGSAESKVPADNRPLLPAQPFVVCLGTLQPRKNIPRLIDAFVRMKESRGLPHSLVIAGRQGWMCQELVEKINATPGVVYLGYVEDRLALLQRADLLVQPSLYEGFGLSILDAFAQRVPVACSNISSLPEVAGDAAEFFDPYSVQSIATAMIKVLTNPTRAEELRLRGSGRLNHLTWEACARKTLAVLEEQPGRTHSTNRSRRFTPALLSKTIPPYTD
jgi:glycosyltransferase involved in cell wall biosynthesis